MASSLKEASSVGNLEFSDEAARNQEAICSTEAFREQRRITLDALALADGERVLDVGVGTGHMAFDIAQATSGHNKIVGIDISEDMLDTCRGRCPNLSNVSFELADLYDLPFDEESFDVVLSVQVFEYLEDVQKALLELNRVLKPGGRLVLRDADWGTLIWESGNPDRMAHILSIWDQHLADPFLPRKLASQLNNAGFVDCAVRSFVTVETEYDVNQTSYYIARFVAPYAISQGADEREVADWLADLEAQAEAGRYFYSLNSYIFSAAKS
jgi:ubiquinone/menaquinone biosynthesis C-methylase UbiE